MGVMRFLVPRRERLAKDAPDRAYFTGLDEIPWQSRTQLTEEGLVVRRAESDSGNFHIPWNVAGHGELMLSTASLMEREKPYLLQVELARGTIHRTRGQLAQWQAAGLALPAGGRSGVVRCRPPRTTASGGTPGGSLRGIDPDRTPFFRSFRPIVRRSRSPRCEKRLNFIGIFGFPFSTFLKDP